MARVEIALPALLAVPLGGQRSLELEGTTLREVLDRIKADHPQLATHLFDESGGFREHVLCFHNATNTRWLESLDVALSDGDRVTFMQAVSGG